MTAATSDSKKYDICKTEMRQYLYEVCVMAWILLFQILWDMKVTAYLQVTPCSLVQVIVLFYINKCPTRCNNMQPIFYFTALSLYMFRVPSAPIIRST